MTIFKIDLTELIEIRNEIDNFIQICETINTKSDERIKSFKTLGYTPKQTDEIINVLFGEI